MLDPAAPTQREADDWLARDRIDALRRTAEVPKIEALKKETENLKASIRPSEVYNKASFIQQFEDALARAKNFAEAIFPSNPLP